MVKLLILMRHGWRISFANQGLPLTRRNTVGDDLDALVAILRERSEQADVLIVNGGLGPTSGRPERAGRRHCERRRAYLHPEWLETMTRFCRARQADGGKATVGRRKSRPAPR